MPDNFVTASGVGQSSDRKFAYSSPEIIGASAREMRLVSMEI